MAEASNAGSGNSAQTARGPLYPSLPQFARLNLAPDGANGQGAGGGGWADGGTVAAGGATQTGGEYQVPQGKALVDSQEYERLRQNNERVRGMQPYWEAGSKYGIKKAEDFERVGRLTKFEESLKARGLTPEQIEAAFAAPKEDEKQSGGFSTADLDKYLAKKKYLTEDQVSQREAKTLATVEHKQAESHEQSLVKKAIAELAEGMSTREKKMLESHVLHTINTKRAVYPQGHPLHDSALAPFDEKSFGTILAEIQASIALSDGEDIAKLGDATAKGKTPTAGASTSQPAKTPSKSDEMRPGGKPSVATLDAAYAKKLAARGQKPVSSAR